MTDIGSSAAELQRLGFSRGAPLALVLAPRTVGEICVGIATAEVGSAHTYATVAPLDHSVAMLAEIETTLRPRWVLWSSDDTRLLVQAGVRLASSWDLAAVHRLLVGGWEADPGRIWAHLHDLAVESIPTVAPHDLFNQRDPTLDPEQPIRDDGHLDPDWVAGRWVDSTERVARWAGVAATAAQRQMAAIDHLATSASHPRAATVARSESTIGLLCVEMETDGLPLRRSTAEAIIERIVGPRTSTAADAARQRSTRDDVVLRHAPAGTRFDLRSPGQVKSLLRSVGIEVPDTRAGRLSTLGDTHPVIAELLTWRKAERVATTYGYDWLDRDVGDDERLRGRWSGCDGAAGRMTASAGLHNLPAEMRPAVLAEPGHAFVRSDLGQIEPRVLAAVSGDEALARAAHADDMYGPVAADLGVDRETAKVAMLGAMYGQTTGHGAEALRGLRSTYPIALAYLEAGDRSGRRSQDLRTYGGRRIQMGPADTSAADDPQDRSRSAARGRYGRNALVQGAAAELFKIWAVTVRARSAGRDAHIVLCLHDELLVHVTDADATEVAAIVDDSLDEAVQRWAPRCPVRFVTDTSVITSWAEAK